MTHLYNNFNHVTSLVDYYGFRGKQDLTVEDLEMQLAQGVSDRVHHWIPGKVIPYVQKYEFEGLLFSNVSVFAELPDVPMGIAQQLQLIRSTFQSPEDINEGERTAPSKRILALIPEYSKRVDAQFLIGRMGLETIRSECKRFNRWLRRLESLSTA